MPSRLISPRTLALAVGCASLGAGASAIANAGASTPAHHHAGTQSGAEAGGWADHGRGDGGGRLRGAVEGTLVVPSNGTFATVSFHRGEVVSVREQTLTITEGTKKHIYKSDVPVVIPAGAIVRNNGQSAALSSLTPGERVVVTDGPKQTRVIAHTPESDSATGSTSSGSQTGNH